MSGHLNPGGQQFRDDDGAADPRVQAALAAYHAGQGSEQDALTALAAARLLVPVVAVLAGGSAAEGDKNSEMALPTLIGRDGRPAVLAFTGLGTLARWRPNARPVPAEAGRVCPCYARQSTPGSRGRTPAHPRRAPRAAPGRRSAPLSAARSSAGC